MTDRAFLRAAGVFGTDCATTRQRCSNLGRSARCRQRQRVRIIRALPGCFAPIDEYRTIFACYRHIDLCR